MTFEVDEAVATRLEAFLHKRVGQHLARREQKESFAMYAHGIVGDGERKSVEPIAARASADKDACERTQARLLNFLRDSPWEDSTSSRRLSDRSP